MTNLSQEDGVRLPVIRQGSGSNKPSDSMQRAGTASKARQDASLDSSLSLLPSGKKKAERFIEFQPCSPGQMLEMAKFLGVDTKREFYLLTIVRKALTSPFPRDWAVGHDRKGVPYYYNKYTMKVMDVHPLSDTFLEWVEDARQAKEEEDELRKQDQADEDDDERSQEDMGTPWMRFTTSEEGEYLWYHFGNDRLHTDAQYKHILHLEMESMAVQQPKEDPRALEKMKEEMKAKQALSRAFASGLRKAWMIWHVFVMDLRTQRAQALVKAGVVGGRSEARAFRQWKDKSDQLAKVRKAMAPLGGRRSKGLLREAFREWKWAIEDALADQKEMEEVKMNFLAWKEKAVKSLHLKKVKAIIKGMLLANSSATLFLEWKALWEEKKDNEVATLEDACIKIQRQYRARIKRRMENHAAQNQRKQMKYRLLRVCEDISGTSAQAEKTANWQAPDFAEPEDGAGGGSLAIHLLEGAIEDAHDEAERARLRQVVRIAKSKGVIGPDDEGFGLESVRDDITRIVDLIDPIDRVKLRQTVNKLHSEEEESDEKQDKKASEDGQGQKGKKEVTAEDQIGQLEKLSAAVEGMVSKIANSKSNQNVQDKDIETRLMYGQAGSNLESVGIKVQKFVDTVLKPEARSKALQNQQYIDDGVGVLEELDTAVENFMTELDKKRGELSGW